MELALVAACAVVCWLAVTLRGIRSDLAKLKSHLGIELAEPDGLPELTQEESHALGVRLGEAGVLPGEMKAIWARESLYARLEKALRAKREAAVPVKGMELARE